MHTVLSHNSALEMLRSVPPQTGLLATRDTPLAVSQTSSSLKRLRSLMPSMAAVRQHPVHILVSPTCRRGFHEEVRIHQTHHPRIPAGLLLEVSDDLLCCGPELTFLQMAGETSLIGASVLCFELCGAYAHFSQMISGFYDRPALTSKVRISEALAKLPGARGTKRAREALALVLDGSRSPMETVLAGALSFPTCLGGCAFEQPRLNYQVILDQAAAGVAGVSRCYLDLAWPAQKRALEYDGAAWHTDARADRRRREALAHMGWTVNVIDLGDISSIASLAGTVRLIQDCIPRESDEPIDLGNLKDLLSRLLKATRFGLGANAALFGVPVEKGLINVHL